MASKICINRLLTLMVFVLGFISQTHNGNQNPKQRWDIDWMRHDRISVGFEFEGQNLLKIRHSSVAARLISYKDSGYTSEQKLKMPAKYVFRMQHSHPKTRYTAFDTHFTVDETGAIRNCPIALGAIHPAAWPSRRNRLSIGGSDPSSLNEVR